MTNKEILHADLLDILFENRNKAYGAYALRKNYSHGLQWALGISLSFALLLSIINVTGNKSDKKRISIVPDVTLRTVNPPDVEKSDPPKPKVEPLRKQITYTDQIKIDPDKTEMPDHQQMITADISTRTVDGPNSSDTVPTSKQGDRNEAGDGQRGDEKEDLHLPTS